MKHRSVMHRMQEHTMVTIGIGTALLLSAAVLILLHARALYHMQDNLPLLSKLPVLERKLALIEEQLELSQYQAALQIGSDEERIAAYILPEHASTDRAVAFLELLPTLLSPHVADLSSITVGDETEQQGGLVSRDMRVSLSLHEEAYDDLLRLLRLAGMLTVSDALTPQQRLTLLEATEAENPAGIVSLEQFFATDLLQYAMDSRAYHDQLLKSFSVGAFSEVFRSVSHDSRLSDAVTLLGGASGRALQHLRLWPLPFLVADSLYTEPGGVEGWSRAELTVRLYGRSE